MKKRVHDKLMFFMKVSCLNLLILTSAISLAHASFVNGQSILEKKVSIELRNKPIREALSEIEKVADIRFLYYSQLLSDDEKVSIRAREERLATIFDKIFSTRKIKFEADGNQVILTRQTKTDGVGKVEAQSNKVDFNVSGTVVDEQNQPLPGVNILLKGTSLGTATDAEGKFSISVRDKDDVLIFSFIGYTTTEVLVGDQTQLSISLQADIATLSEVVVVGYGTQKKSDVISSISSVDAKDLVIRSTPNFEAGLQGVAAGVSVQSQSGSPGAPVRVLIRGTSSINLTTDPLYIIDGMPISVGTTGPGSSNLSPMSLINQNDIERIEILKDAAATAIYGSRGSNGVIIVTTKSGKKEKGSMNFNYSGGISQLTRTPSDVGFANTSQWFSIMDAAYANSGEEFAPDMFEYYDKVPRATIPLASPRLNRAQAEAINTDWYDELFNRGSYHDVNLSMSRGSDKTSFFFSGNYRKDNGVQINNDLERFSIRTNLDFDPHENITFSSRLTFGYTKNNQRPSGITSIAVDALPWFPVRELDNPQRYYNAYTGSNPVAVSDPDNVLNQVQQYRGLGGISMTYRSPLVKGLSIRTELSGDVLQSNRVNWTSGDIRPDSENKKPQSSAYEETITFNGINYNIYGNYDRVIKDHTLSLVGGVEATRWFHYIRIMSGTGLNGKYQEIGSPNNLTQIRGQKENERYLMGYFGRLNYKFKERYLAGLSVRRDGSSVFTDDNRWGTFVSFSAGWILSEEPFMNFLGQGTFLKLRGSYGEVGNQNIPPNLDAQQYNLNPITYGSTSIGGVNGTIPINIAVRDLRWESTKSSDVGIDFGFFNNRLNGSIAYYHRYVNGMLLRAPLPYSTGVNSELDIIIGQGTYDRTSSIWGNFGDMVNSGLELEIFSTNYDKNGFRWTTSFNIGFNKNTIGKLTSSIDQTGGGFENVYGNSISRTGDRRAVWFIADYAGVDPDNGVPMIYARDQQAFINGGATKRLKNNVGEDQMLPATISNIRANRFYQEGKSGDPKYQGGITNSLFYKGFDLSFMIAFSGGNYILDYDRQQATIVNPTRNILAEVYDKSWKNPGDIAEYPQMRAHFTYNVNNVSLDGFSGAEAYHNGFLYKGDFIRLRNIQLGYTLSGKALERLRVRSARLFVSAANLFTSTSYPGFDPEGVGTTTVPGFVYYANSIPQLKTFAIGTEIKF